jgi:hypothetical protein
MSIHAYKGWKRDLVITIGLIVLLALFHFGIL